MSENIRLIVGWVGLLASPLLLLVPHYYFWFGIWFMVGMTWFICWVCVPMMFSRNEGDE